MKSVHTLASEVDVFANIRDSAPVELLGFLDQIVTLLPEGFRYRLKQVFDSLPPQGDNLQRVLEGAGRSGRYDRSPSQKGSLSLRLVR